MHTNNNPRNTLALPAKSAAKYSLRLISIKNQSWPRVVFTLPPPVQSSLRPLDLDSVPLPYSIDHPCLRQPPTTLLPNTSTRSALRCRRTTSTLYVFATLASQASNVLRPQHPGAATAWQADSAYTANYSSTAHSPPGRQRNPPDWNTSHTHRPIQSTEYRAPSTTAASCSKSRKHRQQRWRSECKSCTAPDCSISSYRKP